MGVHLAERDILQAALAVQTAFGMAQRAAADVRRENFDFPGFHKFQRITQGDGDGVSLFTGGTTGAPDAQGARVLPEFAFLYLGQNSFFQRVIDGWITKERCFLRQQALQQGFVFGAGALDQLEQCRAAG
jgi:hypothetical protein